MKKSVLLASLIAAAALTACGKKEESAPAVVTPPPAAVTPPAAPARRTPRPVGCTCAFSRSLVCARCGNAATEEAKKKAAEDSTRSSKSCCFLQRKPPSGGFFLGSRRSSQGEPSAALAVSISSALAPSASAMHAPHDLGPVVLLAQVGGQHMAQAAVVHGARNGGRRVVGQMAVVAADPLLEEGRVGRSRPACRCRG